MNTGDLTVNASGSVGTGTGTPKPALFPWSGVDPAATFTLKKKTWINRDSQVCVEADAYAYLGGKGDKITLRQAIKVGLSKGDN